MSKAQFTLRGNICHVQVGSNKSYTKFDLPANKAIRDYYEMARAAGETHDSFANTSTQYAPVVVQEKTVRRLVIPARMVSIPETVLSEEN